VSFCDDRDALRERVQALERALDETRRARDRAQARASEMPSLETRLREAQDEIVARPLRRDRPWIRTRARAATSRASPTRRARRTAPTCAAPTSRAIHASTTIARAARSRSAPAKAMLPARGAG
jgi:hypothetical protein